MKKNGFTLVELLAVITILGIISLIIVPTVDSAIKDAREKVYEKQKETLLASLQEWLTDNKDLFYETDSITLTLGDLKEQNYVDYDIRNPKTEKCISNDLELVVQKVDKKYEYSIVGDKIIDGKDANCDVTKRFPSIYLVGTTPFNLEINENYVEPGYSAKSMDGTDITSSVISTNNIDNTKLGSYKVTYKVTSEGLTKTKIRTVNVVDTTAPVIIIPSDVTLYANVTEFNIMDGVSITDNSGEALTVKTKSNLSLGVTGKYEIVYTATDSSGNYTTRVRKINVDMN